MAWRVDPEGVELRALSNMAPVAGLRVLELGCGDGRLTVPVAESAASVFAVDPDEDRVASARAALPAELEGKVTLSVAGAVDVDPSHGEFDLALFSWSLWWIEGEGVVHALRHVHSLLVPGGTLVDMHPVTEEQVESGDGVVGVILEPEWLNGDLPNSEAALREVVGEGLYVLEAETDYDVLTHFDGTDDLEEARADLLEGQDELVRSIRAAPPPLRTRMHVVLRRLRAVPTPPASAA